MSVPVVIPDTTSLASLVIVFYRLEVVNMLAGEHSKHGRDLLMLRARLDPAVLLACLNQLFFLSFKVLCLLLSCS